MERMTTAGTFVWHELVDRVREWKEDFLRLAGRTAGTRRVGTWLAFSGLGRMFVRLKESRRGDGRGSVSPTGSDQERR